MKLVKFKDVFGKYVYVNPNRVENLQEIAGVLHKLADIVRAYDDIKSLHDCNDCGKRDCQYRPLLGQMVRINCPLWEIGEEE